jgi:spore maturation protein CgeB
MRNDGFESPTAPADIAVRPRVLVIGASRAADSMESHVIDSLEHLGCTVSYVSTRFRIEVLGAVGNALLQKAATSLVREPERLSEKRLLRRAEQCAPDLVLVIQGNHLSPKTVALLRRRLKVPIVCWCQDHVTTLSRQYMLGADYDAIFVKDRYMQELFSSMVRNTPFVYLPEACNPRVHRPLELAPEDRSKYGCDVMLYGSLYYYRQAIVSQLAEFDLKLWGNAPSWFVNRLAHARAGGEVVLDAKAKAVRAARIALNPLHYGEIDSLNCRAFELAGCGAFQLITYKPILSEHFEPGVDLDAFRSIDELIEKIRHYLRNPEQAAELARNGQIRAHRDHTYEIRLTEIFRVALNTRGRGEPTPAMTARQ